MKRDAEAHAAEDKKRRELAEARNTAEQRVYQLEKLLEETKDKLSESDRAALQAAIDKVNEAKKGETTSAAHQPGDRRAPARQPGHGRAPVRRRPGRPARAPGPAPVPARRLGPGGPSPDGGAGPGGKPEDVIDVEFEEKK